MPRKRKMTIIITRKKKPKKKIMNIILTPKEKPKKEPVRRPNRIAKNKPAKTYNLL